MRGYSFWKNRERYDHQFGNPNSKQGTALSQAKITEQEHQSLPESLQNKPRARRIKKPDSDATDEDSTTKAQQRPKEDCLYWSVPADNFIVDYTHNATDNSQFLSRIRLDIRGNPLPLRRHRSSRGFMYNPSAAAQDSFRKTFQSIVEDNLDETRYLQYPLFPSHLCLRMTLVFYLRRPKHHFVAGRPGPGRLRPNAPPAISPTKKDIDNLAKFVMDSLNGVAYADDHQIASLQVTKFLDDHDECLGRAQVHMQVIGMESNEVAL